MGKSLNGKELGAGMVQRKDGLYQARFTNRFGQRKTIENSMQPKTLSKILGHGTLQITMDLYCHVTDDTLFEEMQKMDRQTCV